MGIDLITPTGSDFISAWPGQNEVNCDRIDAYAGPCLTSHPLQSYIPQLTGVTSNPALGTGGIIRGYYYKIFDQIYTWGEFKFGSGATFGSGAFLISLPFSVKSILGATTTFGAMPVVGLAYLHDNDSVITRQVATALLRTTTQIEFAVKTNSGAGTREVGHSGPVAWAQNDGIYWSARYQRLP